MIGRVRNERLLSLAIVRFDYFDPNFDPRRSIAARHSVAIAADAERCADGIRRGAKTPHESGPTDGAVSL